MAGNPWGAPFADRGKMQGPARQHEPAVPAGRILTCAALPHSPQGCATCRVWAKSRSEAGKGCCQLGLVVLFLTTWWEW